MPPVYDNPAGLPPRQEVISALHVHLVFMTKYRRSVPNVGMLQCCQVTMRKVCADFGAELRDFNDQDDDVHLLVDYPPKVAISALVNSPKRVPARRLRSGRMPPGRRTWRRRAAWAA